MASANKFSPTFRCSYLIHETFNLNDATLSCSVYNSRGEQNSAASFMEFEAGSWLGDDVSQQWWRSDRFDVLRGGRAGACWESFHKKLFINLSREMKPSDMKLKKIVWVETKPYLDLFLAVSEGNCEALQNSFSSSQFLIFFSNFSYARFLWMCLI